MAESKGLTTGMGPLTKELILGDREIPTPDMATIDDPAVIPTAKINAQFAAAKARIDTVVPLFPALADQVNDPTTTIYGYDPESNLLILEDENGSRVYIRYDATNRPIAVRAFRAGQNDSHVGDQVFAPNPVSAPSSPGGSSPPVIGTTKQDFQYDGLSRLVMATDNNDPADGSDDSLLTIAYDSLGRAIEEQQQIAGLAPRVVSTGWRAENLRNALTFPNGRVIKYTYDTLDRIRTIGDDGASQRLVQYNYIGPARVLERLYLINGTRLTHLDDGGSNDIGYDGLQRQVGLRHLRTDNSTVVGFAQAFDRANNKLTEEKLHAANDSELYRFDSLYRLVQFERGRLNASKDAIDAPSANIPQHGTWKLDGAGNWASVDSETREHSSVNEAISRSPAGELPVTLTRDDNGNLTNDGEKTFEWDVFNRLRRVRKNVSNAGPLNGATLYYFDGHRVIEEQDGAELLTQQYVFGNYIDEVLVMDRNLDGDNSATGPGDQRIYYHQNGLMHVYALTDAAGGSVEGYLYDAYGRHMIHRPGSSGVVDFGGKDVIDANGSSGVGNPYLFTGRRLDPETGLFYCRARYLDPGLGRFISRDPIGLWTDTSNLGNEYAYTGNNPLNRLDPLGLDYIVLLCRRVCRWEETTRPIYDEETGKEIGTEIVRETTECWEECEFLGYVSQGRRLGSLSPHELGPPDTRSKPVASNDCRNLALACLDVAEELSQKCVRDAAGQWVTPTASRALMRMAAGCGVREVAGAAGEIKMLTDRPKQVIRGDLIGSKGATVTTRFSPRAALRGGAQFCLGGAAIGGVVSIGADVLELFREMGGFREATAECVAEANQLMEACNAAANACLQARSQ